MVTTLGASALVVGLIDRIGKGVRGAPFTSYAGAGFSGLALVLLLGQRQHLRQ